MNIIDGKKVSQDLRKEIECQVEKLAKEGIVPGLAVLIVGDNPASKAYVKMKGKACGKLGIYSETIELSGDISEEDLIGYVDKLNIDDKIDGILVQLPLPKHIDESRILQRILPEKDVDGFHPVNIGKLAIGENCFIPCTPYGIIKLLEYYNIETNGKHCVIIGRSNIVGKPIANLMLEKNSTVTICHSRTKDLPAMTRSADILIAAVGKAKFVTADMVKEGAIVIDVGINRTHEGVVGDVDFDQVQGKVSHMTPVPGGVGPMTITMLMYNTLKSAERKRK